MAGEGRPSWGAVLLPYALLIATDLLWAGNSVIGRGLNDHLPPVGLAWWRWTVAALLLTPFAGLTLWRQRALVRENWRAMLALSFFGIACYNTLVYSALQTTEVINAVMMICATPVFILLISRFGFGETVRTRQWLGAVVSLAGVGILITRGDPARLLEFRFNAGDFMALAGAVAWAIYSSLLRLRPKGISPHAFVLSTFWAGSLILLPVYLWETASGSPMIFDLTTAGAVIYVAVFASLACYFMWNAAVSMVGANVAGAFFYLFPVFSSAAALIVLHELPQTYHAVAVAAVFLGIYLITGGNRQPAR
jgi:drug/metabolite transporter (DMT)-like permease